MLSLRDYLTTHHDFTADDWQRIDTVFLPKTYAKGDYLVQAGQTDRYLWFIDRGILRIFEEPADGPEQTFHFVNSGQLMADPESFNGQTPALVTMQAITPCHTRAVSHTNFQRLAREIPAWSPTIQRITQRALLDKVQQRNRLVYEDAKTRYQRLLAEQPAVVQQVALGIIASYLGITLSSLSRLRKQLAVTHA